MKKYVWTAVLLMVTICWLYFTSVHYKGLNSIQALTNYHSGLPGLKGLPHSGQTTINASAIKASIQVDDLGIPHIFGNDLNSLAYSTGYIHARDRYFQMELIAHTVMGSLSEIVGEEGVGSDKHWKRFECEEMARRSLERIKSSNLLLYQYLLSYTAGVNAYISAEKKEQRDPLYAIWDYSPGAWKPYYSFFVGLYMSSELAFYDDYVNRQEILDKLSPAIRKILYPEFSENAQTIIPGERSEKTVQDEKKIATHFDGTRVNDYVARDFNPNLGSNNWVVGKTRTVAGELFLANDLHLGLSSPNVFYELHISGPGINAYGYTVPGVPFIVTGHNDKIAWGITNGGWDVTEQYLLKINEGNAHQYWLDGKWKEMTKKEFTINVRGEGSKRMEVEYTVFGPVVRKGSVVYGLKWYPAESCNSIESFWKLMEAADWNTFREALRGYDYPSQNFVFGDVKGNIGMICAGKMPRKPDGYNGGLLNGQFSSQPNFILFDSLPQSYNPKQDYLYSANQEPEHKAEYYSSRWFSDLYRPSRIGKLLADDKKKEREDISLMQLDVKDISVDDIRSLLNRYASSEKLSPAWEAMRNFSGVLSPSDKEAVFYKYMRSAAYLCRLKIANTLKVKSPPTYDQYMYFLNEQDSITVEGIKIESKEQFKRLIKTTDSLYARSGNGNPFAFTVNQITELPYLEKRIEHTGGSDNTINVNYDAHPVIRTVVQLTYKGIDSWMINAVGQTGRINDKNYFQQLRSWEKNDLHKTQFISDPKKINNIAYSIEFVHDKQ